MKIVNCTRNLIVIIPSGEGYPRRTNEEYSFPADRADCPARVFYEGKRTGMVAGIPLYRSELIRAENIPEPQDGVLLIVNDEVRQAFPERDDLVSPFIEIYDGYSPLRGVYQGLRH